MLLSSYCLKSLLPSDDESSDDGVIGSKRKSSQYASPALSPNVSSMESMESKKMKARQARDAQLQESPKADLPDSKRVTHNGCFGLEVFLNAVVLERKRRNDLKVSYQDLRESIPELAQQERAPTAQILQKAVEFIEHLKQTEEQLLASLAAMRADQERLRAQLAAARSA
jgi:Myc proto-oncogene protein